MSEAKKIMSRPISADAPVDAKDWSVAELLHRCTISPPDELAWNEFVRRYHLPIKKNIIQIFQTQVYSELERKQELSTDQVDDLVQGVYMRLIKDGRRALQKFRGAHESSIYRYLMMISVNVVRDYFREMRAIKRPKIFCSFDSLMNHDDDDLNLLDALPQVESESLSESSKLLSKEDVENAIKQLGQWKSKERDVLIFKLRFYEGLSLREIAKVKGLKLSPMGIGTAINRVLKKLRAHFQKTGENPFKSE
jgi:RNA polymerase sigma factor (sigma-70 family)